ncbi:hypothetical protein CRG98_001150 [Punica granatum]|uniref:Uncharacterized protein n=1 Tax=Punica granatum TaxID=22663 RepID=A0A2I0LCM9_PUNGR|nr:hypothetical protein CRG98_001150 [Punica granatum]
MGRWAAVGPDWTATSGSGWIADTGPGWIGATGPVNQREGTRFGWRCSCTRPRKITERGWGGSKPRLCASGGE